MAGPPCPQAALHRPPLQPFGPLPTFYCTETIPIVRRPTVPYVPPAPWAPVMWMPWAAPSWNPVDAWYAAILAQIVYGPTSVDWAPAVAIAGDVVSTNYWPLAAGSSQPQQGIAVLPDRVICAIAGTDSDLQTTTYIATHAFDNISQSPDGWKANQSFYAWAYTAWLRLQPIWVASGYKPLELIGHSLGAAVCGVLSLLAQAAAPPNYQPRLWTFGGPKWANATMTPFLEPVQPLRWANTNDPVVQLPPPSYVVNVVRPFVGNVIASPRLEYTHHGPGMEWFLLGGVVTGGTEDMTFNAYLGLLLDAVRGTVPMGSHVMDAYREPLRSWSYQCEIPLNTDPRILARLLAFDDAHFGS